MIKTVYESKGKGSKMSPMAFLHACKNLVIPTGDLIKTPESVSMGSLHIFAGFQAHGKAKA